MAYVFLALIFTSVFGAELRLDDRQESAFRGWFTRIVWEQFRYQANRRWNHRDCAGLVRFALKESFVSHDFTWKKNNSVSPMLAPPEIDLTAEQKRLVPDVGFERAIRLVQNRTKLVSRNINDARPGDLLFYDFGETQHLMIWMGTYVAYHNGNPRERDNGLKKLNLSTLMTWKDTRWRPLEHNPNFAGIFRFSFLR